MTYIKILFLLLSFLMLKFYTCTVKAQIKLDHLTIAVNNLEENKNLFEKLGFTVKPGRLHKNSINNYHIKFADGTQFELITATKPIDNLAQEYLNLLSKGDGGAFIAFRSSSINNMVKNLSYNSDLMHIDSNKIFKNLTFSKNSNLRPLWFTEILNPFTEVEKYTTHKNGATSLTLVWLSNNYSEEYVKLFKNLGYSIRKTDLPVKNSNLVELSSGKVKIISHSLNKIGRPIVGATIEVDNIKRIKSIVKKLNIQFQENNYDKYRSIILETFVTGSIVLEFKETKL